MNQKYIFIITVVSVLFVGCDSRVEMDEDYLEEDYLEDSSYEDSAYNTDVNEDYYDPYIEYCLQGSRLDVDPNTLTSDDCIFRTEGRNRPDMTDMRASSFYATVSDYLPLEDAGISSFGIDIKVGNAEPKIKVGVYDVIPYSVLNTEEKVLPDIMVHLSSRNSDSAFSALMTPDIEKIKQSASELDMFVDYEIVSASLTVTHVEDIPMTEDDESARDIQAGFGMLSGQQYVKGTFTFTIKKSGPNGADFGPETFTFGSRNDWAYFPDVQE